MENEELYIDQDITTIRAIHKMAEGNDFDDIDAQVEDLCDALELSFITERRQLNDIQETKQRVLFLVSQGDQESISEAAEEAYSLAERIQLA
jgi:hypothetical protein